MVRWDTPYCTLPALSKPSQGTPALNAYGLDWAGQGGKGCGLLGLLGLLLREGPLQEPDASAWAACVAYRVTEAVRQ